MLSEGWRPIWHISRYPWPVKLGSEPNFLCIQVPRIGCWPEIGIRPQIHCSCAFLQPWHREARQLLLYWKHAAHIQRVLEADLAYRSATPGRCLINGLPRAVRTTSDTSTRKRCSDFGVGSQWLTAGISE